MTLAKVFILLSTLLLVASCGEGTLPAGASCAEGDACDETLQCLPFAVFSSGVCETVGTMCTRTCGSDADCAELGASFRCFATCEAAMTCAPTE